MGVTCLACGQENREGRKFCAACGARLGLTCPGCGSGNEPGEQYCGECGAALAAETGSASAGSPARREPEGERKQVTVLFADVQGSMTLQEDLDVEAWTRIVDRFVHILADGVRRFGGTVDKFTGDGIMALFGAPVAQEDHARRACFAAWHMARDIRAYAEELRQAEGVDLHVRIGLNSGEAVVGRVGEDLRLDPLGHAVGLAQRMEAMAVPGTAYLTEHTARLVEGWFRLRDLGPRTVKGARAPLGVFALEGPAPPRSASRGSRATSRLVGRASEMARLEEALNRAAEGHAQVVGVVGEPGVGKSRLCDDFAASLLARGIIVRRTAGVSHGREVPLLPILALLRDYFGITDSDTPGQARERMSDRLLALDPAFLDDLPVLFDFLEVPDPERPASGLAAEVRMRRVFEVLRRVTARRSEREAIVLVFEDLQWFDPQSEAFLERLIENFPGSRTLVVANFRPEFSAAWMRHSYYQQLSLAPLSVEAVEEMLRDLLGDDESLAPLPAYLIARTGGNPFFVEEVVRALVEDGTLTGRPSAYRLTRPLEQAALPASVHSVLAARIDRLAAEHKPILQSAAVIGRTFGEAVLARVIGQPSEVLAESLSVLCAAELLQEVQRYPLAEYRFWHPLTQEVAYGTMLAGRRARLHAAVAEALIELETDRLDERAALVASHFEGANDHVEAARWNARAATWARRSDIGEAVRRWQAVTRLLANVRENDETLRLGVLARARLLQLGSRIGISSEEADELFAKGRAMAEQLDDPEPLIAVSRFYTTVHIMHGEMARALTGLLEVARLGDKTGDCALGAGLWTGPVFCYPYVGPLADGLWASDVVLALSQGKPDNGVQHLGYSPLSSNQPSRARLLARMGRLSDARRAAHDGLALSRSRSEAEFVVYSLASYTELAELTGAGEDTLTLAAEAVRIAEDAGGFAPMVAFEAIGITHLIAQRWDEAADALDRGLSEGRAHQTGLFLEASFLSHLARACLGQGKTDAAVQRAQEAVEVARRQGARVVECLALLTRAQVGRSSGATTNAVRADLDAALLLVGEVGALTYEPFIREELGRLHTDESELREAARLYEAIGATGHARRLTSELIGFPSPHRRPPDQPSLQ